MNFTPSATVQEIKNPVNPSIYRLRVLSALQVCVLPHGGLTGNWVGHNRLGTLESLPPSIDRVA